MARGINPDLDAAQFYQYTQDLSRRLNASIPLIVTSEAAAVMKLAASKHRPAKASKVRAQSKLRAMSEIVDDNNIITINTKRDRGRVWFSPAGHGHDKWLILGQWEGGANYIPSHWRLSKSHWKTAKQVWKKGKGDARIEVAKSLASRGLSGKSWVEAIRLMGRSLLASDPKSARVNKAIPVARPSNGRTYRNVRVYKSGDDGNFSMTVVNGSPTTLRFGGRRKLSQAIQTRRKFAQMNAKKGFLKTASDAAAKYPGIYTR